MRKLFLIVLDIVFIFLVMLFIFSLNVKEICVNTISSSIVKKELSSNLIDNIKETIPRISNETLEKIEIEIQNSGEIDKITEKYFDSIIDYVANDDNKIVAPDIEPEIKGLIKESKPIFNKKGINITDNQINKITKSISDSKVFNVVYEKMATDLKENLSDDQVEMVNVYHNVQSKGFKKGILVCLLVILVLIIIASKSIYKWLKNISIPLIISGITLVVIIPIITDKISNFLTKELIGRKTIININNVTHDGFILLLLGFLTLAIYLIINIFQNKKKHV